MRYDSSVGQGNVFVFLEVNMGTQLRTLVATAGVALAASAGAQTIIYERPNPAEIRPASEVYQAPVVSARAVKDAPQQHYWTERHDASLLELPFAIVGGAVKLAAGQDPIRYDRRCSTVEGGNAWDVTYKFGGVERTVRMSAPPGPTIAVNRNGEPQA
jgi:hypothetical protein